MSVVYIINSENKVRLFHFPVGYSALRREAKIQIPHFFSNQNPKTPNLLSLEMGSSISLTPTNLLFSSFSTSRVLHFRRSRFSHRPSSSSSSCRTIVAQFGFRPGSFPDPVDSLDFIKDHAENLLHTIADAAVSSSDTFESVAGNTTTNQNNDWFSGIANYMETVLKVLKDGLSTLHVPYSYGFAIILLTVLVKAATFPLTKKQVSLCFYSLLSQRTTILSSIFIEMVVYSLQGRICHGYEILAASNKGHSGTVCW